MSNPKQRDDVHGTAASASSEYYLANRRGDLKRYSDGFRTPTPSHDPRRPTQQGYKPDLPVEPWHYNPPPPAGAPFPNVPRNFAYLRAPDLGAPRVGRPDAARTDGHLQRSGEAWGRVGEQPRAVIQAPTEAPNAPPAHVMGQRHDSEFLPRSARSTWRLPSSPTVRGRKPGASTAM